MMMIGSEVLRRDCGGIVEGGRRFGVKTVNDTSSKIGL